MISLNYHNTKEEENIMSIQDIVHIASKCNHYAMCKIDFLGTGLCPSGKKLKYVSYFPEGRMELANALAKNIIPITEKVIEIADSCNLCGICDKQCYFITEMRPMKVMRELKAHVESHCKEGKEIIKTESDEVLQRLQAVVGELWATNDPGILITYSRDATPFIDRKSPLYVVMVSSKEELTHVVRIAHEFNIPYTARSSGGSGNGLALGEGIIIDFYRMKRIEIDLKNSSATIEPGVTAFELQHEATKHKLRAVVAEPAACVCSNIIMTRLISLFANSYGLGSDLVIDAQYVNELGELFDLSDPRGLALLKYEENGIQGPPLCAQMTVKLFPMAPDESGLLIPFADMEEAMTMARDIGKRGLGFGLGVVSADFVAFNIASTIKLNNELKSVLQDKLGINFFLVFMGDRFAIEAIRKMSPLFIDQKMLRIIIKSIPELYSNEGIDLLSDIPSSKKPYELLFKPQMHAMVEMALSPKDENLYNSVEDDLKDFYKKIFSKPDMTDILWVNMFRITSARIGRGEHFNGIFLYFSLDELAAIPEICAKLKGIGDKYGLRNDFGYNNIVHHGKWGFLEYDYYHDHTDEEKRSQARNAILEAYGMIDQDYLANGKLHGKTPLSALWQGQARTEFFLYK